MAKDAECNPNPKPIYQNTFKYDTSVASTPTILYKPRSEMIADVYKCQHCHQRIKLFKYMWKKYETFSKKNVVESIWVVTSDLSQYQYRFMW